MKLLLDENISRRALAALQDAYPGSTQVTLVGLERESDRAIWDFARAEGYVIVTKDDDFLGLSALFGHPPKMVLPRIGNSSTQRIVDTLTRQKDAIILSLAAPDTGVLEIY